MAAAQRRDLTVPGAGQPAHRQKYVSGRTGIDYAVPAGKLPPLAKIRGLYPLP
jgi:hypothetical protein